MNPQEVYDAWPGLPLAGWQDTYETLHRWCQIVGKTSLALAPFQNHWWHCALHVSERGLRTQPLFHQQRLIELEFDFIDSALIARTSDGAAGRVELAPRSVADFYAEYLDLVNTLGFPHKIYPIPSEMADTLPFAGDTVHAAYDADAARSCWQILLLADRVLKKFRSGFYGKCSPSHFWWGGFDLACTRFSGKAAPEHPGGVPNLPDWITREAYSHECISAGWWPGNVGGPVSEPAFYAYAYPEPPGCPTAKVRPAAARYDLALREWILPYEAVRTASNPDAELMAFLETTYDAAAGLGHWDRALVRMNSTG
jgi:Family of unknown function (DUF5996)